MTLIGIGTALVVLMWVVSVVRVSREGVVPPSDWLAQSSMREAPWVRARMLEGALKVAISRMGGDIVCGWEICLPRYH